MTKEQRNEGYNLNPKPLLMETSRLGRFFSQTAVLLVVFGIIGTISTVGISGELYSERFPFLYRENKKGQNMKEYQEIFKGIDVVKLSLYKILVNDFSEKYKEEGEEFYKRLAAAIINEIFLGSYSGENNETFEQNKEIVNMEIENLGKKHPELKKIITIAMRFYLQASFASEGRNLPENYEILFESMRKRGLFLRNIEIPDFKTFLGMADILGRKYLYSKNNPSKD